MTPAKELRTGVRETRDPQKALVSLWRWGLLIALIALWEAGVRLGFIDRYFFSSPSEILETAIVKWQSVQMWRDIV